jgi:hypothetical protein
VNDNAPGVVELSLVLSEYKPLLKAKLLYRDTSIEKIIMLNEAGRDGFLFETAQPHGNRCAW